MPSIFNSTIWSTVQRFGGLAISFISNIVLARLLCPNDFGAVALIMVFVGLADVLVDGGLGNALVQKKDLTQSDIKTVFLVNIFVSVLLFIGIFIFADIIEQYVSVESFALYLRVESVIILIRAFYVVNYSLINKEMKFKHLAVINIIAQTTSTIVAIILASYKYGIWSLIIRNISVDLLSCVLYMYVSKVSYKLGFSWQSFKDLFGYGFFIAISNILESAYSNLLSFLLGKKYSVEKLGYYNQAHSLEQIPVYSSTMVLNQVLFPYLSKFQDNNDFIRETVKRSSMVVSFIIYPIMVFLICFAEPIIVLLYTSKWLPAVPLFQILCIGGFTNFLYHTNRSILKSIGESKLLFYAQVISVITGLLLLYIGLNFEIQILLFFIVGNSIVTLIILGFIAGRKISYTILHQILDVLPNASISLVAGGITLQLGNFLSTGVFVSIVLGGIVFIIIYLGLHSIFHTKPMQIVSNLLSDRLLKYRALKKKH